MEFLDQYSVIWIISMALLIAVAVAVGVWRNRIFHLDRQAYEDLTARLEIKLAFELPQKYRIFGIYRGYQAQILPYEMPKALKKEIPNASKISLAMVNPNRKSIHIYPEGNSLAALLPSDALTTVKHDAQDWLRIRTNDMLFSSLLLSDDVKISLGAFFQQHGSGLIYLSDDELACILPGLIDRNTQLSRYTDALDLLCDMKDALN